MTTVLLLVALVQTGSCHSILLEAEAAITLFKEALDILGDRPHNKQLAFAEKWGQGNSLD